MTEIPPLVLLLQPDPAAPGSLVSGWRDRDGSVSAREGVPPSPAPAGALLVFWPARFGWTPAAQALSDEIRDGDGVRFPLATVMESLGLPPARSLKAVLGVLAPDLDDAVDPELVGRRLVEELAAHLRAADRTRSVKRRPRPAPGILFALEDLPDGPGVYTFLAADETVLYLGKAKSLRARVPRHFDARPLEPAKSEALVTQAARLVWESAGSELEALIREQLALGRALPPLNTQERAHVRRRGAWRRAVALLVLPSADPRRVEVCLVAGDGRFHWESAPRRNRVPRGLWRRLGAFLAGEGGGWGPGGPREPLSADGTVFSDATLSADGTVFSDATLSGDEGRQLAEVALSWLVRHGDGVTRIDLTTETFGRHLQDRLRALLGENPAGGRLEVRR